MSRTSTNFSMLIFFSLICGCASVSPQRSEASNIKRINACNDSGGTWLPEYNYCQPSKRAEKEQEKWLNIELDKIRKQRQ